MFSHLSNFGGYNMRIGERIKRIRTMRGMTQKELGLAVGFPARSADVRIAQYENGVRNPKEDMVKQLATALHVHPSSISNQNGDAYINLMYNLFDIENTFGIHIDQIDGELCLRLDRMHKEYVSVYGLLLEWYEEWKKGQTSFDAGNMYEEWKLTYPPVMKRQK